MTRSLAILIRLMTHILSAGQYIYSDCAKATFYFWAGIPWGGKICSVHRFVRLGSLKDSSLVSKYKRHMSQGSTSFYNTLGIFNAVLNKLSKYPQKYSVCHWLFNFTYSTFRPGLHIPYSHSLRVRRCGIESRWSQFSVQMAPRTTQCPVK
jgi:hypothetical protein